MLCKPQDSHNPWIKLWGRVKIDINSNLFPNVLTSTEPTSLAWKDQARELLRLYCSSYEFDKATGWHESAEVWVGKNVDTDCMILLHPARGELSMERVESIIAYTQQLTAKSSNKFEKIMIAVRNIIPKVIEEKYQDRVSFFSERSLLRKLINWSDYANEIRRRVEQENLVDSDLCIKDAYVQSRFMASRSSNIKSNLEDYLLKWLSDSGQRQIALLGEYGQGKSTTALMLTYNLLKNITSDKTRIPILIELRGRNPRNQTPLRLLGDWGAAYNISAQALMRLHQAGRLLIIFEGFDEMSLVGDAETRLSQFITLWSFSTSSPKPKILITGRPNFFLDGKEMETALGMILPMANRPYCEAVRLAPFSLDQIRSALQNYSKSTREQICELANKNTQFFELISRHSLLHIVAVIWDKAKLHEQVDQLNSAHVLELFMRHSYRRQGSKGTSSDSTPSSFMALTSAEREYFMKGIAVYMVSKDLQNEISTAKLNNITDALIANIPDRVTAQGSSIYGETTTPLRLRLITADPIVAFSEQVQTDVRTCGLLVDTPGEPGKFRFAHKSFLEYLFAAVAADYIKERSEGSAAILRATGGKIGDIISQPNSIRFLAELLGIGKYTSKNEQEQAKTAIILLNAIVFDGISKNAMQRKVYFLGGLYQEAIAPLQKYSRSLHAFASGLPWVGPLFTFPFIHRIHDISIFWEVVAIAFVSIVGARFNVGRLGFYRNGSNKKLGLWAHVCKQLGISRRIMLDVVTPGVFFWLRKGTFDFCSADVKAAIENGYFEESKSMPDA